MCILLYLDPIGIAVGKHAQSFHEAFNLSLTVVWDAGMGCLFLS